MFTIDASVWVSSLAPAEPGHPASLALLKLLESRRQKVIVPNLVTIEIASAVSRQRGDASLAIELATTLRGLEHVTLIPLDETVATEAVRLAAQLRLRGADAVYAAVASLHRCTLVSLDHEHLTRLPPVVTTVGPADALAKLSSPAE